MERSHTAKLRQRILVQAQVTGCGLFVASAGVPAHLFNHEVARDMWVGGGAAAFIGGVLFAHTLRQLGNLNFTEDDPTDPEDPDREDIPEDSDSPDESNVYRLPLQPSDEADVQAA